MYEIGMCCTSLLMPAALPVHSCLPLIMNASSCTSVLLSTQFREFQNSLGRAILIAVEQACKAFIQARMLINHSHLAQHAAEWQSQAMLVSTFYAKITLQTSMCLYQQFTSTAYKYFWTSASKN